MEQQKLIIENIYEALTDTCRAIASDSESKSWLKIVGSKLWPEKSPDDAGRLLSHCLDKNRSEKLDPEQLLWILKEGRAAECHILMHYIASQSRYRIEPITLAEQLECLQRDYIEAVNKLERITFQMRKMQEVA